MYNLKYYSTFTTKNNSTARVEILEDGYSGSSSGIKLDGNEPVTIYSSEKEKFDVIRGTGCYINVFDESQSFEFMDLFNGADKQFKVKIYTDTNKLRYVGYVMPELFNQGLTKGKQVVQIPVADGLGYLDSINMIDLVNGTGNSGELMQNELYLNGKFYKVKDILYSIFLEISNSPIIYFHSKLQRRDFADGNTDNRSLMECYLDIDTFKNLNAKEFIEKFLVNHRVYQYPLFEDTTHDVAWFIDRYKDLRTTSKNVVGYDGTKKDTTIQVDPIEISFLWGIGSIERNSGIRETRLKVDLQEVENLIDFESLENQQQYSTIPNDKFDFTLKPQWGKVKVHNSMNVIKDPAGGKGYRVAHAGFSSSFAVGIVIPVKNTIFFNTSKEDKINIEITYELSKSTIDRYKDTAPKIESKLLIVDRGAAKDDIGNPTYFLTYNNALGIWQLNNLDIDVNPETTPQYNRKFHEIDYVKAIEDVQERTFKASYQVNLYHLTDFSELTLSGYNDGDEVNIMLVIPGLRHTDNTEDTADGWITEPYFIRNITVTYDEQAAYKDTFTRVDNQFQRRSQSFETLTASRASNEYANNIWYHYNGNKRILQEDWTDQDFLVGNTYEDILISTLQAYTNEAKLKLKLNLGGTLNGAESVPFIYQPLHPGIRVIENDVKGQTDFTIESFNYNLKFDRAELVLQEIDDLVLSCSIYLEVDQLSATQVKVKAFSVSGAVEFSKDNVNWFDANVWYSNAYVWNNLSPGAITFYAREKNRISCIASIDFAIINTCTIQISSIFKTDETNTDTNDGFIEINLQGNQSIPEFSIDNVNWQLSNQFSSLAPGSYTVYARESALISCVASQQVEILEYNPPFTPVAITSLSTQPDTGTNNGQVTINTSDTPADAEYQVISQTTSYVSGWQSSNVITGLDSGSYTAYVRSAGNTQNIDYDSFNIIEDLNDVTVHWYSVGDSGDIDITNLEWTDNNGSTWNSFSGNINDVMNSDKDVGFRVTFNAGNTFGGSVTVQAGTTAYGTEISQNGNGGFDQTGLQATLILTTQNILDYDNIYFTAVVS